MAEAKVSPEQVDAAKKWALIKFRGILRGARITEQIQRWLSGELGSDYRFQIEMVFDDKSLSFLGDSKNRETLGKETLV
jgi:hypothetical protein